MKRITYAVVAFALIAAACGNEEGLLGGVGDMSREFVYGETTTTTTLVIEVGNDVPLGVVKAADVEWFNDTIEPQVFGEPSFVIAQVWGRGDGTNRFIQASRSEIAAALPNISFPELLPDEVGWITSQLVYDLASGVLDGDTSAAFGLWQLEPYTVDEGRVAVLRVGVAPSGSDAGRSEVLSDVVDEGLSLIWTQDGYRYELFCRATLVDELCWQMAETVAPLRLQLAEDAPATLVQEGITDASGVLPSDG